MGKMIDLGKENEPSPLARAEGMSAQSMNYPEFHVESDQLPIDGDHVGKHVHATVKLHVKGHEVRTDAEGKETKHTHFAVKGIKIHPAPEESDMESESEEENPAKKKSDRLESIKKDYEKGE